MAKSSEHRDFRLTKIICTLGPASNSSEMIERLAGAGMNIARVNMSHGDHEGHLLTIRRVRSLNRKLSHSVPVLLDLKGPEIRTGAMRDDLHLMVGEIYTLTALPMADPEAHTIHVDYQDMATDVRVGDRITVDNGLINMEVLERHAHALTCRVLDGGKLGPRKHINLPGIRVNLPSVTDKDCEDIRFGVEHDVDFIALSFVRNGEAIVEARRVIEDAGGHHAKIIAKIENEEGVEHFDEILAEADGIMVARGDLGVEVRFEELPVIQRDIVRKCVIAGKPVIVATHLLESMIEHPMPTRAEVTDVANAVYEQVDAIMLSGETATGKHPVRCVEVMDRIARRIEKATSLGFERLREPRGEGAELTREQLAKSACRLADSLDAPAIVVFTRRGELGQLVASHRPARAIIYAFTNMTTTRRKLWLSRAVVPFKMDFSSDPERTIVSAFERLRTRNRVLPGDRIVVVSDVRAGQETVSSVQVRVFE